MAAAMGRGSSDRAAHPLTDHEVIRAEERGARPSCVRETGGKGDLGMIRLDFPGYSGPESLQELSWDNWFEKFDERNLALLVQDRTASEQRSNFNKLVKREGSAKARTSAAGQAGNHAVTQVAEELGGWRSRPPPPERRGR